MNDLLAELAQWIAASNARESATWLLRNVPGLPPIAQTIHLLSIAAVMGSVIFINLRVLGIAAPRQHPGEMIARLMPWTWYALIILFVSGLPFILARPARYFTNPVFQIKFLLLVSAVALTFVFYRLSLRETDYWTSSSQRLITGKMIAAISLVLWLGIVMAGRWIAYSDYLFWPG
jgi:hypothetical protein